MTGYVRMVLSGAFVSLASLGWGVLTGVALARPIWLDPGSALVGCCCLAWMNVVLIFVARRYTTTTAAPVSGVAARAKGEGL